MRKATVLRPRTPSKVEIDAAVGHSALARMPRTALESLVTGGKMVHLASRAYFIRNGGPERVGLVVSGLTRCYGSTSDGRELTFAWGRAGVIVGLGTVVVRPQSWFGWQAVSETFVLEFSADEVRRLGRADAGVAWALAEHLGAWLVKALDDLMLYAYGDLRARITVRLLELACKSPATGPLIADVTQEDLALSVGASRPSVARVLREMREEGVVRSLHRGILIERPEALAELTANA